MALDRGANLTSHHIANGCAGGSGIRSQVDCVGGLDPGRPERRDASDQHPRQRNFTHSEQLWIITACVADWARFAADNGQGEFGLYRYDFTINKTVNNISLEISRSGRINTDSNTSLCSLKRYNASRHTDCNADSPCRDDCGESVVSTRY